MAVVWGPLGSSLWVECAAAAFLTLGATLYM